MKRFLTLPNVLKCVAAVFGLAAFFLMFGNQLYAEVLGKKAYVGFDAALFGDNGSVITFIGYLLVLLSVCAVCALVFVKLDAKLGKAIDLGLAGVLVLGAVFVFIEAAVVNGRLGASPYHLAACPILAGIFAIVAALATAASEFVPQKKLLK